jgi:hypothetical protein
VWGARDRVIPVAHAHVAHELIPGSRLEIVEDAGHFVPLERPERFVAVLDDFLTTTTPAAPERSWHDVLTARTAAASSCGRATGRPRPARGGRARSRGGRPRGR